MKQEHFKLYDTTPYQDMSLHHMLRQFHDKFGIGYEGPKRSLSPAEMAFRIECHREEAQEYEDANTLVGMLDALVDECYFLAGTAHRMGMQFEHLHFVGDKCPYDGEPRALPASTRKIRLQLHQDAIKRVQVSMESGVLANVYQALAVALHAFSYTAAMHGFDLQEATRRVHAANMEKDVDPSKQRRRAELKAQGHDVDHMMEITKPDGWLAPYLGDLVGDGPYQPDMLTGAEPLVLDGEEVYLDVQNLCGLITIDGPDASGKSTLAARIAEVTGGEVIHLTWTPELAKVMDMYRVGAISFAAALAHDRVVVLERPWASHVVYSHVYRPTEQVNLGKVGKWRQLTEEFAALNILSIPRDANEWLENYRAMCASRAELHGDNAENALAVYDGFSAMFTDQEGPFFHNSNLEIYDMQQFGLAGLDRYIADFVLPRLKTKGTAQ